MSMSRAQLAAELWGRLQTQFTVAGITNADTTGNLKEPVDSALMALGIGYGDLPTATVADSDVQRAIAWAVFYGYSAVIPRVADQAKQVSTSVGAPSVSKSTNGAAYLNELRLLRDAAKDAAEHMTPGMAWAVGELATGVFSTSDGSEWG